MGGYNTGGFGEGGYGGSGGIIPYTSLITSEHNQKPNFMALVAAAVQPFADITAVLQTLPSWFDLDTALGSQLDVLGQWIGQSRTVGFQPSGGVSPILDDTTYRLLLRARIAQNQWKGQIDSLYPFWQALFTGGQIQVVDNQNMTCSILVSGAFTSIVQDLITNGYIIPRPQGVLYTILFPTFPIFGFGLDNTYVGGFGHGHWA